MTSQKVKSFYNLEDPYADEYGETDYYAVGADDAMSEEEKLRAAIATYRAQGNHVKANALDEQLQALEMTKARGKARAAQVKATPKKKSGAVVIPGTPKVYRHSKDFPMWPLVVLGTLGLGAVALKKR
jgi:hypothetical protein